MATTIYVDPRDGLDTNDGQLATPVKTIIKALRLGFPTMTYTEGPSEFSFTYDTTGVYSVDVVIRIVGGTCVLDKVVSINLLEDLSGHSQGHFGLVIQGAKNAAVVFVGVEAMPYLFSFSTGGGYGGNRWSVVTFNNVCFVNDIPSRQMALCSVSNTDGASTTIENVSVRGFVSLGTFQTTNGLRNS